jgi:uncharacterized protein (TIGR02271 family)
MLEQHEAQGLVGSNAYDNDGDKIGKIGQVFLDDETGRPEFVTVNTGFFGSSESFIPIADARRTSEGLAVPFDKDKVKGAPQVSVDDGHLSQSYERELYEYYGMTYSEAPSDSGLPAGGHDEPGTHGEGRDLSGPTTDDAMTRAEERLDVGTRSEEAGRVRLRKHVVTEHEQVTVPVTKERAVIEREPITDANRDQATSGPEISEEEHELTLHEERPVVDTHVEAVERVRLGKEQETHDEQVSAEVRKEQIEADGDLDAPRDGR